MLLEGIYLPLTTPFYPDGRLYLRKLEHNVDRYSRTPAAGMLVLGSVGEGEGLTDEETTQALTSAIAAAAPEKVMIAAVGRESVFATLRVAEAAAAAGYDAIAVKAPGSVRNGAMQVELITYFQAVADRSPIPVVLLSEGLPFDLLADLAGHPQVLGAVDADASAGRLRELQARTQSISRDVTVTTIFEAVTGRMLRAPGAAADRAAGSFVSAETLGGGGTALAVSPPVPALKTRTKKVGFQVLAGATAGMLEAWRAGASGALPRLGACAPQACCEVWQAHRDGDPALADEKQQRILLAAARMEGSGGIAAIKHGCDLNGYFGGRPRLPLIALNGQRRESLEQELAGLRN